MKIIHQLTRCLAWSLFGRCYGCNKLVASLQVEGTCGELIVLPGPCFFDVTASLLLAIFRLRNLVKDLLIVFPGPSLVEVTVVV